MLYYYAQLGQSFLSVMLLLSIDVNLSFFFFEGQAPMDIPLTPKRSALSSLPRKLQSVQDRAMQTLHPVGANAPTSDPTAQTEAVKGQPQEPASRLQSRRIAHARRRPDSAPPGRDLQRARRRRSAGGSRRSRCLSVRWDLGPCGAAASG